MIKKLLISLCEMSEIENDSIIFSFEKGFFNINEAIEHINNLRNIEFYIMYYIKNSTSPFDFSKVNEIVIYYYKKHNPSKLYRHTIEIKKINKYYFGKFFDKDSLIKALLKKVI